MANTFAMGHYTNIYNGTINTGGTLSSEVDLGNDEFIGFWGTGFTAGTIGFNVRPDTSSAYGQLIAADGSNIEVGPVSGTFSISAVVLEPLKAYRYVQLVIDAQTNGAAFKFITKA